MTDVNELYVIARRVLLDALDALGPHRRAIVLVGAQAVYLRVGEADLAIAPFTTDGDLVIDPASLAEIPPLEQVLSQAGFFPSSDAIGEWIAKRATSQHFQAEVAIDLLVPRSVSPSNGRRAARLPGHHPQAARLVEGLDGAIIDADVMHLSALEPADARAFDVRVAGPAALLVAKVHKIDERQGTNRQSDKDALDVLRLLRGTETADLAVRYERLLSDPRSADAARTGQAFLEAQFSARTGIGIEMAIRSAGPLSDPDEIAASCSALTRDLLTALQRR